MPAHFETVGNAMIQISMGGKPVLVTDPWLDGSAYFGSWELERPLTERQIHNAASSEYIWFSHGHPDHFHPDSFVHLSRTQKVLLPDHYSPELAQAVAEFGFQFQILPNKRWVELKPGLRVLCAANENMDAIVAFDVEGKLLLNKNDSPFCGEDPFFRKLVAGFRESYLLALCAYDADMINIIDGNGRRVIGEPEERKPGVVWSVSRTAEYLGVKAFCCSSSQHVYARPDSAWANDYRINWADMQRLWAAKDVRLIAPFSSVDLDTGIATETDPGLVTDPVARIKTEAMEDWAERLDEAEWARVERFALQFETLRAWQDFVAFTVGGETRRFYIRPKAARKSEERLVGVTFSLPRPSLLATCEYGYFDDLLIGNFMKTQLHNMTLYPNFSPLIAKLGGNAKVLTRRQLWKFRLHFARQSPLAFVRFRAQLAFQHRIEPAIRAVAHATGLFAVLKAVKRQMMGGPKLAVAYAGARSPARSEADNRLPRGASGQT